METQYHSSCGGELISRFAFMRYLELTSTGRLKASYVLGMNLLDRIF
jgi:hypothetical protein